MSVAAIANSPLVNSVSASGGDSATADATDITIVQAAGAAVRMPAGFPATAEIVERLGWKVQTTDISELRKAEAGVTCSSLVFASEAAEPGLGFSPRTV